MYHNHVINFFIFQMSVLVIVILSPWLTHSKKSNHSWPKSIKRSYTKALAKHFYKVHNGDKKGTILGDDAKGRKCSKKEPSYTGRIEYDSTCPWVTVTNYNPARYPEYLADVECLCDYCNGKRGVKHVCQRVGHKVPVFYKNVKGNSGRDFIEGHEMVHTGCTCVASNVTMPRENTYQ